jgi:predicted RNA-binding protein associated with RNAse of E/G family
MTSAIVHANYCKKGYRGSMVFLEEKKEFDIKPEFDTKPEFEEQYI